MKKIPERMLQEARSRSVVCYMQQQIGDPGNFKNNQWWFCSPLRDETQASFSVNPGKNVWFDYGLGVGGDIIALVERLYGFDFKEAVSHLSGMVMEDIIFDHAPSPQQRGEPATTVPPDCGQAVKGRMTVEKFFRAIALPYYPEIGAFPLTYKGSNYIGFPVEDPKSRLGIECRGFIINGGVRPVHKRMTLGRKLPWVFRRDPEVTLVTESITDSLAGEVLLGDASMSLLALNGVQNVKLLPDYVTSGHVLLAMDNDGDGNGHIGQKMQEEAEKLLLQNGCKVSFVTHHINAGVKDLHRLLLREAGISHPGKSTNAA
jgi:hypothetical protein